MALPGERAASAVAVRGDYAYVAHDREGVHVVDIRDPSRPRIAATIAVHGRAFDIDFDGGYAYVAEDGVSVFDMRDPLSPTRVARYTVPPHIPVPQIGVRSVAATAGDAYAVFEAATHPQGIMVLRLER
jgi:hypothetical protein